LAVRLSGFIPTFNHSLCGGRGIRTHDFLNANQVL
jgi:hypothetical protein